MVKKQKKQIAIDIDRLEKTYNSHTIFSAFSATIYKDSFTIVKGPSGCGKTTLLSILAGLDTPTKGIVKLNDIVATNNSTIVISPFKRNIGYLFQEASLWPHMSSFDQLSFVWKQRHESSLPQKELDQVCNQFTIDTTMLSLYPHELSRGQKQRIALARATITHPSFLFLDEPYTGLDMTLRKTFSKFLSHLVKERNTTILMVTHDLIQTNVAADHVVTFKNNTFILDKAHNKMA